MNTNITAKTKTETWESLLHTADSDFINVLISWYSAIIPYGTIAWMMPHSLEKYLKSFLLSSNSIANEALKKFGKSGHGLKEIWIKYKSISNLSTTKPRLNQSFDDLISLLDSLGPNIRYSGFSEFSTGMLENATDDVLYFYIVLCSLLRYQIIGKQHYRETLYGLDGPNFYPMNYDQISDGYGKIIIYKMLHLTLEHACSFTLMGSINSMDFNDLSISNTAKFEKLKNCPICKRNKTKSFKTKPIEHLSLIKFYRNISPTKYENSKSYINKNPFKI